MVVTESSYDNAGNNRSCRTNPATWVHRSRATHEAQRGWPMGSRLEEARRTIRATTRMLDDVIDMNSYPVKQIEE